ncbi:MAG: DUF692 family multinuclear iron-containing protein [Saprospiraceae bacterium]
MSKIFPTIACNLDSNLLLSSIPLFESEKVQAIEWSFDALFKVKDIPSWFTELLETYSKEGRLIGHGVFFSLFSGKWSTEQQTWLDHLGKISDQFQFDHITEHFGFMTGEDFHKGAPISVPFNKSTLALGQDRLKRIYQSCKCPVGLENLAFSYSIEEVKRHGDFLDQLLQPINGFIILDLHNLYCQLHNFEMDYEDLIELYPLEKVREIHISGGSWEDSTLHPTEKIRRDTHDDKVPDEVFFILEKTMKRCPNLKFVVIEQLGFALDTSEKQLNFQKDFFRLNQIVEKQNQEDNAGAKTSANSFLPKNKFELGAPFEDLSLHAQQIELSSILENAKDYNHASQLITNSSLCNSDWKTEEWAPYMLETVMLIAQKWKNGN